MPSITSLVNKLTNDFPQLIFSPSSTFKWNPVEEAIYYDSLSDDTSALLHEVAHAILKHAAYTKDVELLRLESDAWVLASDNLSKRYKISISEDVIQESLDTYRNWLHARSICPKCQATGIQIARTQYQCITCRSEWTVNEAKNCALRRYLDTTKNTPI